MICLLSLFHSCDYFFEFEVFFEIFFLFVHFFEVVFLDLLTLFNLLTCWHNVLVRGRHHQSLRWPNSLHRENFRHRLFVSWSHVRIQTCHFGFVFFFVLIDNGHIILADACFEFFLFFLFFLHSCARSGDLGSSNWMDWSCIHFNIYFLLL